MMIPVVATGVYAVSGDWSQSILPESWTIKWLLEIWTQERFFVGLFLLASALYWQCYIKYYFNFSCIAYCTLANHNGNVGLILY